MKFALPSDLVPQLFAGQYGNLFAYSLVGMEVQCQLRVVFLDNDPSGFLHRLCSDTCLKSINVILKFII